MFRDSSGIRIADNAAVVPDTWTVAQPPLVDIGMTEGARPYMFDGVRDVVRLSDGSLAVADAGSREVRFFDSTGHHLTSAGGKGTGPGEFGSLSRLEALPGDTVAAWDPNLRRLSLFTAGGELVSDLNLQVESPFRPRFQGFLADGTFVLSVGVSFLKELAAEGGIQRISTAYVRFSDEGRLLDTLGVFPGRERFIRVSEESAEVRDVFFGRQTYAAAGPSLVYLGDSDGYEIRGYEPDGSLIRLIRRSYKPAAVTDDHLWAVWNDLLENYPSGLRARVEEGLQTRGVSGTPHRETLPAFSALQVTADGDLWVRESTVPGVPERWASFDGEGRLRATLEMPERFQAHRFGADYVLGVARDALEVEHVRMYRMGLGTGEEGILK